MSRKKVEPISKKFVFFLIFMLGFGMYYVLKKDDIEDITSSQTYEEQLEYHDDIYDRRKQRLEREKAEELTKTSKEITTIQKSEYEENKRRVLTQYSDEEIITNSSNTYERLLDALKSSPYQSTYYINIIVDQLLTFKGYPKGTIKVKRTDLNNSRAKIQGSYLVANFDVVTGTLNIEEAILNQLPSTTIIAVLSHELDHFDKIASICRYMGVDQFEALLNKNGIANVDTTFWRIASTFGKTQDFNGEYYKQALERFISQNKLSSIGTYTDFYRLAENLRNPLEISAYEQSDYVYNHYGIKVQEGPTQKLVKEFNDIDWLIYNQIQTNSVLRWERIAVFDYLFANAVIEQIPDLKSTYNSCINLKDGDLTAFWNAYKSKLKNFYSYNGQLNANEFATLMSVLNSVKAQATKNISQENLTQALANKINTIKDSPLTEEEISDLKRSAENYIILEQNKETKQVLICKLILLCIENNLTKDNMNEQISLYYLKFPSSISSGKNQKQELLELYNHPSFKAEKPSYQSEQEYLIELINKHRLNVN